MMYITCSYRERGRERETRIEQKDRETETSAKDAWKRSKICGWWCILCACIGRIIHTWIHTHACSFVCITQRFAERYTICKFVAPSTIMFYYANTFYHGQRNIGTRTRVYFISLSFFLSLSLSLQHIINGSRDVALNNYRYLKRKKKSYASGADIVDRRYRRSY